MEYFYHIKILISQKWMNIMKNYSNFGKTHSLPCFKAIFKDSSLISETSIVKLLGNGQRPKPFYANVWPRDSIGVNIKKFFYQIL